MMTGSCLDPLYDFLLGPDRSLSKSSSDSSLLPYPSTLLAPLTTQSLQALANLSAYQPLPSSEPCPQAIPAYRRAAVLLSLFVGRNGELYVILSKRSSRLRSHSGDTALPGGRFEPTDTDLEFTARREAFEETGLPIDTSKAVLLCQLPPFLSANELVVTPFVVLLTDHSIKPHLNPREVDSLFSLPLVSFLYHRPPDDLRPSLRLSSQPDPEVLNSMPSNEVSEPSDWHTCRDILWLAGHRVRRHTFWHERNPIRGLTSDILIKAASIGYRLQPSFSQTAPNQPSQIQLIQLAFTGPLALKRYRVRPRMQFLRQADTFSFSMSYPKTDNNTGIENNQKRRKSQPVGEELQQPQDDRGDFPPAPPLLSSTSSSHTQNRKSKL